MSKLRLLAGALLMAATAVRAQCPIDAQRFIDIKLDEGSVIQTVGDLKIEITDHDYDRIEVGVAGQPLWPVPSSRVSAGAASQKNVDLRVGPRKSKADVIVPEGTVQVLLVRTFKGSICRREASLRVVGSDSRVTAIIVGISDYRWMHDLTYAAKDADDFEALLHRRIPTAELNVRHLIGPEANLVDIGKAVKDATRETSQEGTILIYFSGHGMLIEGDDEIVRAYLVPWDAKDARYSTEFVSHAQILEQLAGSKARNKIVILDACFSGISLSDLEGETDQAFVPKSITPPTIRSLLRRARDQANWRSIPDGVVWFSGSHGTEVSYEGGRDLENGVFTHYLLRAGDSGKTYSETFQLLMTELEQLKRRQRPHLYGSLGYLQKIKFPLMEDQQ